jgi:EAL domain-containing protein (putative c-di-GMP-specific phosphodiesterase class I)
MRFTELRAAWVQRGAPIESQLFRLIQAQSLSEMVSADSSPLAALLNDRRIETWFQPIFWAGTLEVWGYECLMRARDENGGLIGAPTLLEWARQEHLTFMLDRVSRETHLGNAGRVEGSAGMHFLVNFLPTAIYRPEFCLATTVRAAAEAGLDPERVIFEVVETEQIPDSAHLQRILSFYREKGFRVALDDVGSGYSGLALLGDLNPDLIKIDRDLVSKSVDSSFHRGICEALARLGHENGLLVLAEGIETEAQWEVMEQLGANLLQGFLFGRPDPVPAKQPLVPARHAHPLAAVAGR